MKSTLVKSAFAAALGIVVSTGVFAQTTPSTTTNQDPKKGEVAAQREESKDQWLKKYNEMKPKLDAMSANEKLAAAYPDFVTEETKLNKMATAYKAQLDNWDKAHASEATKHDYMVALRKSDKDLNDQYVKTKNMWDKIQAEKKKAAPAKQ